MVYLKNAHDRVETNHCVVKAASVCTTTYSNNVPGKFISNGCRYCFLSVEGIYLDDSGENYKYCVAPIRRNNCVKIMELSKI